MSAPARSELRAHAVALVIGLVIGCTGTLASDLESTDTTDATTVAEVVPVDAVDALEDADAPDESNVPDDGPPSLDPGPRPEDTVDDGVESREVTREDDVRSPCRTPACTCPDELEALEAEITKLEQRVAAVATKPPGLAVYNGKGELLGGFRGAVPIGADVGYHFYSPDLEHFVTARKDGTVVTKHILVYEYSNCQGDAWTEGWGQVAFMAKDAEGNLWKPELPLVTKTFVLQSYRDADGKCMDWDWNGWECAFTFYRLKQLDPPFEYPIPTPLVVK